MANWQQLQGDKNFTNHLPGYILLKKCWLKFTKHLLKSSRATITWFSGTTRYSISWGFTCPWCWGCCDRKLLILHWVENNSLLCLPLRLWSRTGTQGNKWRYAQVTLISNQPFYIIFEGVRGRSYMGDIALDDVDVADGPCPAPKACDFETDMCKWTNVLGGDQFNWTRDSGGTPSLGTGPSADHTTGTRNGLFLIYCTLYLRPFVIRCLMNTSLREERVSLSVGYPPGTHARNVIGCCSIVVGSLQV